jgi:hypothetical protein
VDRNVNSLNFEFATKEGSARLREENSRITELFFQAKVNRIETSLKDKTDSLKNEIAATNRSIDDLKDKDHRQ